ncbi:hypothetical protein ILUMI_22165 [Ignelater luminosus]|uniref:HTH psq-type domain-containing protein n=1 Tax=Ignelater luminosus TaxID=2038154 RepID=A0A8K0CHC9_IGNLU|nr:hypothetical protein ILUMI_22165 [Ignelater luminosus]
MPKVREGVKYEKQYTEENVSSALEAIENRMSQRKASETFNIPRQTLQFRKSSKCTNKTTLGPSTVLTSEEKSILEEWIVTSHKKSFSVRKLDIQASVKEFLDAKLRENPFHENLPGDEELAKVDTIKNGFRASGLFPWNASVIDYTKCLELRTKITTGKHQDNDMQEMPFISYLQFKNIVGEERINLFEQIEKFDNQSNDEFILLYKIHRGYRKNETTNSTADIENTPERKGKKGTKRVPFVLTSSNWRKLQIEKLELEKQEQERKETRKTKRLLKHDEKQ